MRTLQRQLTVGASDDPLEHEADRVADQILASSPRGVAIAAPPIQRSVGGGTSASMLAPKSVEGVLANSGHALPSVLRQDMAERFGYDFSHVRVHTDRSAEESAREINANAYTAGHHIVFAPGRFSPATSDGRRLIAHELAHVVQQGDAADLAPAPQLRRQRAPQKAAPAPKPPTDGELRQYAQMPHLALKRWKSLTQAERDKVFQHMQKRYGGPFTAEFRQYASGAKKPRPGLAGALKGADVEKRITASGYRHAYGEIWVHPSGEYLIVLAPARPEPIPDPTPEPEPEPEPEPKPDPDPETCSKPCADSTHSTEECQQCCRDTIAADDFRCRSHCLATCEEKID
jgi:hypothetical protein